MVFSCNIEKDGMLRQYGKYCITMSKTFFYQAQQQYLRNGSHIHDYYEVCFVLEGKGQFCNNGILHSIQKDSLFIGTPHVAHEIISDTKELLKLVFFTFSIRILDVQAENQSLLEHIAIVEDFLKHSKVTSENNLHIGCYFNFLSSYFELKGTRDFTDIYFCLLLDVMKSLSYCDQPSTVYSSNHLTREIVDFINHNIYSKVTIGQLCAQFNLSERSLYYLFEQYIGKTPTDYINYIRISNAAGYLRMGYSIKRVADLFNFSEVSSFSRMFKRYYGVSPSDWVNSFKDCN